MANLAQAHHIREAVWSLPLWGARDGRDVRRRACDGTVAAITSWLGQVRKHHRQPTLAEVRSTKRPAASLSVALLTAQLTFSHIQLHLPRP